MAEGPVSERLLVVEQIVSCTACELHTKCTAPVAFSGPAPADIAIVGEAPGRNEDEQGEPFIGAAGKLLREHLLDVGLDGEKHDIAFVNTVSCFPDGTPTWDHVNACAGNKERQLGLLNPQWVLLAGKVALKAERKELEISRARGKPWQHYRPYGHRVYFATYHPAAALRNGNMEKAMNEDLHLFAAMVEDGIENWEVYLSDQCVHCSKYCVWMEDTGLGYCEEHLTPEGRERFALIEREAAEAKARLAAQGSPAGNHG